MSTHTGRSTAISSGRAKIQQTKMAERPVVDFRMAPHPCRSGYQRHDHLCRNMGTHAQVSGFVDQHSDASHRRADVASP